MKFSILLAKKYLSILGSTRNGAKSISYVTLVAIFGVALGVSSLFVVVGVMDGFEDELSSSITRAHGEVIVYKQGDLMQRPDLIAEKIKSIGGNEIVSISPILFSEGMLTSKTYVSGSIIEGINVDAKTPNFIGKATKIPERIIRGRLPANDERGIVLGSLLAEKLKVNVGDKINLLNPVKKENESQMEQLEVVGIIQLGMYDYDSKYSYLSLNALRNIYKLENGVSAFKIKTVDRNNSEQVVSKLKDEFDYPYLIKNWSSLNKNLLYAIKLEKFVISLILGFIILVASFNIISTLMLMVHDKRRDLAILSAMGLGRRKVASVFLMLGGFIGFVGSIAGGFLGYGVCMVLKHSKLIDLPADIYSFSFIPIIMRFDSLLIIIVSSSLLTFFATIYPAWYISGIQPVEGLRYE